MTAAKDRDDHGHDKDKPGHPHGHHDKDKDKGGPVLPPPPHQPVPGHAPASAPAAKPAAGPHPITGEPAPHGTVRWDGDTPLDAAGNSTRPAPKPDADAK